MNTSAAMPLAESLNEACQCVQVDRTRLAARLARQFGTAQRPIPRSMVSGSVVFAEGRQAAAMERTISLISRAVTSQAFESRVTGIAPPIARGPQVTGPGLLGFDFHLGGPNPQLIEINTNPGGLLVALEIAQAAIACCDCLTEPLVRLAAAGVALGDVAKHTVESFRSDWRLARGAQSLRTIAIVDDGPRDQYLYPEFLLYRNLFEGAGLRTLIADVSELSIDGASVAVKGVAVDLVYNRCTDFYLDDERHSALRTAYERGFAVITPHPAGHARWADKRLLAWLGDDDLLAAAGLDAEERAHLHRTIPRTEIVDPAQATEYWARRKELFFKPVAGFGSKATYRGDKLTRATFERILADRYVAQALAPTSCRRVLLEDGGDAELRVDVRNYVAQGTVLLRAARLYRGQATNFRTDGGGFAPVLTLNETVPA
jgi:hypothetical protein